MRNAWAVLGLRKGADRKEIRRAYARKLKSSGPEDDPEAFIAVREAYEWLLAMADEDEAEAAAASDEQGEFPGPDEVGTAEPQESPGTAQFAQPQPEDPDLVRLNAVLGQLEGHLASPDREDRQRSKALMSDILASPAMENIEVAQQVELRVAVLILDNLPASDAIILQASDAFDWDDQKRAHRYPVSAVLDRLEEWRLINTLDRGDHPLSREWRQLTGRSWRISRYWAARTGRRQGVAELIGHSDYWAPGLRYSMDPKCVEWWEAELRKERLPMDALIWRAAAGAAVGGGLALFGRSEAMVLLVAAALALAFVIDFLLMRRLTEGRWQEPRPLPVKAAVLGAMLSLPFVALILPLSWIAAAGVSVTALLLAWAARFTFAQPTGVPPERRYALLGGSIVLWFLFWMMNEPAPVAAMTAVVAVFWLLQGQLPLLRADAAATIDHYVGGFTWPLLMVYAALLFGLALLGVGGAEPQLVRNALAVAAVFAAGGIAAFAERPIPPIVLAISTVFANLSLVMVANPSRELAVYDGMSAGHAIVALHQREGVAGPGPLEEVAAAVERMPTVNPELHRKMQDALTSLDRGTREAEVAGEMIDGMIRLEASRLVPSSSNALLARDYRLKAEIRRNWAAIDPARCAEAETFVDDRLPAAVRDKVRQLMLAIVTSGSAPPASRADAPLTSFPDIGRAAAAARERLRNKESPELRACHDRLAPMIAISGLADAQIGTLVRMVPPPADTGDPPPAKDLAVRQFQSAL